MDRTPRTARLGRRLTPLLIALVALLLLSGVAGAITPPAPSTYTGTLSIVWGDPSTGGAPQTRYFLAADDAAGYELRIRDERLHAALLPLNGQRVTISGALERTTDEGGTTLAVEAVGSAVDSKRPDAEPISGSYPFISILCRFSDRPLEPRTLSFFTEQLSSAAPGMNHYFRELSYGAVNLDGSAALGWFTLPEPQSGYISLQGALNLTKLAQHCTAAADAQVDFNAYYGVTMMFNGQLDGSAWGGGISLTLEGTSKVWPMVWMPYRGEADTAGGTLGWRSHGVLAHEMAHAFGAPHSANSVGTAYGSSWDVVSNPQIGCGFTFTGGTDASRAGAIHPTYSCLGQHIHAPSKDLIGFMPSERKLVYSAASGEEVVTLDRLAQPLSPTSTLMAVMPYELDGDGQPSKFYVVESRFRAGYDGKLPASGVIIHSVEQRSVPSWIVAPPGAAQDSLRCVNCPNGTGDAASVWTPGMTFTDAANGITIRIDSFDASTGQAQITINPVPVAPALIGTYLPLLSR